MLPTAFVVLHSLYLSVYHHLLISDHLYALSSLVMLKTVRGKMGHCPFSDTFRYRFHFTGLHRVYITHIHGLTPREYGIHPRLLVS